MLAVAEAPNCIVTSHLLPLCWTNEKAPESAWSSCKSPTILLVLFSNRNWASPVILGNSSVAMPSYAMHSWRSRVVCCCAEHFHRPNPHCRFAILLPLHGQRGSRRRSQRSYCYYDSRCGCGLAFHRWIPGEAIRCQFYLTLSP